MKYVEMGRNKSAGQITSYAFGHTYYVFMSMSTPGAIFVKMCFSSELNKKWG